jgi:hypothetical protein
MFTGWRLLLHVGPVAAEGGDREAALYGPFRTAMAMLGSRIGRGTEPRLKLH